MSFWLVLEQDGSCDYSIGCGKRIVKLRADTGPDAITEADGILRDDDLGYLDSKGERGIVRAAVVDVVLEFPVAGMIHDYQRDRAKRRKDQFEARERAELERLKRKFGEA